MPPLPSPEIRQEIYDRLDQLVKVLESHPQWTPPSPPRGLYYIWDFVCRSRYIMSELDNIAAGRPTKHPEQIPKNAQASNGQEAAALSYADVCTRSITVNEMIQNSRMLVMLGLPHVDFGDSIKEKARAVQEAISKA